MSGFALQNPPVLKLFKSDKVVLTTPLPIPTDITEFALSDYYFGLGTRLECFFIKIFMTGG